MAKELRFWDFGIRFFVRGNSLTTDEKHAINTVIKPLLGYDDVDKMAYDNGYDTADDMARYYSYSNPRDFFLADGYVQRLLPFKNGNATINLENRTK